MKKIFYTLLLVLFFLFSFSGCNNNEKNTLNKGFNSLKQDISDNGSSKTNAETELSSFSTKIYTPNDEARQKNIRITCSKLNKTVVKSRRNFFLLQYSSEKQLLKKAMRKQIYLIVMEILLKDMVEETVKSVVHCIMLFLNSLILMLLKDMNTVEKYTMLKMEKMQQLRMVV